MPFEHILKQGRKETFPQHLIFFDTETKWITHVDGSQEHSLRLGWADYISLRNKATKIRQEKWVYFEKIEDFTQLVLTKAKPKRTLYIFASNVWFDMRITRIDIGLLLHGFTCERVYDKGLCTIIMFAKGTAKVTFLAIQNYFRMGVEQLGELLGLPKIKVDLEKDSKAKISRYCHRDVEIIREAIMWWLGFIKNNRLGAFGVTVSQQALNGYRNRFMAIPLHIHRDKKVVELERASYYGGRSECFYLGRVAAKPTYKIDINSLYPYAMAKYDYPYRLLGYMDNVSIPILKRLIKDYCCTARVEVKISEPYIAKDINKKTCFPIGQFEVVCCTEVLKKLLRTNSIKKIYEAAFYDKAPIFVEYIKWFSSLKEKFSKDKHKLGRQVCKLLMNSLYGKFGQLRPVLISEEKVDIYLLENFPIYLEDRSEWGRIITYGGVRRLYAISEQNAYHSLVAISAHVTENARLILWDYIKRAGIENVYYCDTDSLFINSTAKRRLKRFIHQEKTGLFKIEGQTDKCLIFGAKDYIFSKTVVCKGIKLNAEKISDTEFMQYHFPSFKSFLQGDIASPYVIRPVLKNLKRLYDKGDVQETGLVLPFNLLT